MSPPGEVQLGRHAWEAAVEDLRGLGRRKFPDLAGPAERDDFATTLFGSIVWPKILGRPDAADTAAGFEVISVCAIEKHDSTEGPVLGELFERVLVAEEASETDEYVVRIVTAYHATTEVPTTLRARLSALNWVGPQRPRLEPAGGFVVRADATGPLQAPPFRLYGDRPSYVGDGPVPIG